MSTSAAAAYSPLPAAAAAAAASGADVLSGVSESLATVFANLQALDPAVYEVAVRTLRGDDEAMLSLAQMAEAAQRRIEPPPKTLSDSFLANQAVDSAMLHLKTMLGNFEAGNGSDAMRQWQQHRTQIAATMSTLGVEAQRYQQQYQSKAKQYQTSQLQVLQQAYRTFLDNYAQLLRDTQEAVATLEKTSYSVQDLKQKTTQIMARCFALTPKLREILQYQDDFVLITASTEPQDDAVDRQLTPLREEAERLRKAFSESFETLYAKLSALLGMDKVDIAIDASPVLKRLQQDLDQWQTDVASLKGEVGDLEKSERLLYRGNPDGYPSKSSLKATLDTLYSRAKELAKRQFDIHHRLGWDKVQTIVSGPCYPTAFTTAFLDQARPHLESIWGGSNRLLTEVLGQLDFLDNVVIKKGFATLYVMNMVDSLITQTLPTSAAEQLSYPTRFSRLLNPVPQEK